MKKYDRISQSIPFFLFIFILVFAPLAFASVELWSLSVVEVTICVLAFLLFWYQKKGQVEFVVVPGTLPLGLLLLWMFLQLVPLPPSFLQYVSPGSCEAYRPVVEAMGSSRWLPVTVNQKATLFEIIRIASYFLLYVVTVQLLTDGKRLRRTVEVVVGCAVLISFLAIIQHFTSPQHIYWFRFVPEGKPFGPWINPSQYAGYMNMVLPLIFGLILYYRPRSGETESLRVRIVTLLTTPGSNLRIFFAFGVVLVLLSIFLSLSRGGILVALVSIVLFFYLLSLKRSFRIWPVAVIVAGSIGLYYLTFGTEEIAFKFNRSFTEEGEWNLARLDIWKDTVAIVKTFWITGSGFGTFGDIYPVYKTIATNLIVSHAHNDYLELLTDGGVVGFLLKAWFVLVIMKTGWKMIWRRRDHYSILITIASMVGMFSMLLYGITNFNMHNGADGLYFFFLCGLVVSAANTRFHYHSGSTLLEAMSKRMKIVFFGSAIALFLAVILFPLRSYIARNIYKDVESVYVSRQLSTEIFTKLTTKVKKASWYDPLEGTYPLVLGDIERYLQKPDNSLKYYLLAAMKNPLRGEFLQRVGLALPEEKGSLADKMMDIGYKRSLKKEELMLNYSEWLLWRGDKEKAIGVLTEGLRQNNRLLSEARPLLLKNSFTNEEMLEILPPKVDVWIKYGTFLENMGMIQESKFYKEHALDFLENEKIIKFRWFYALYKYYKRDGRIDDAIAVVRLGIENIPENTWFRITLGDYYSKQGIIYRAQEEYEQALIIEPNNEAIKKRLQKLSNQ